MTASILIGQLANYARNKHYARKVSLGAKRIFSRQFCFSWKLPISRAYQVSRLSHRCIEISGKRSSFATVRATSLRSPLTQDTLTPGTSRAVKNSHSPPSYPLLSHPARPRVARSAARSSRRFPKSQAAPSPNDPFISGHVTRTASRRF